MRRCRLLLTLTAALASTALLVGLKAPTPAVAQAKYPSRPVQIIVPWAAGGAADRMARVLAPLLEKEMGQPVTVVNRTGGSGAVGNTAGATATPDGHTITFATGEVAMMHWMGLTPLTYRDFTPVAVLNVDYGGVTVAANSEFTSLKQLLDYVRANPGKLKASGTGKGGIWDLARAGMLKAAGIPPEALPWVPSAGSSASMQELVAGGVQVVTCSLVEAGPMIDAGKARPLAYMGEKRDPVFPNVPTLKELGINYTEAAWRGIMAPKGTPPEIVDRLDAVLRKVTQQKEYVDFMTKAPFGMAYIGPKEFGSFVVEEDRKFGVVMKEMGLTR